MIHHVTWRCVSSRRVASRRRRTAQLYVRAAPSWQLAASRHVWRAMHHFGAGAQRGAAHDFVARLLCARGRACVSLAPDVHAAACE